MIIDFRGTLPASERQQDGGGGGVGYVSNYGRICSRERGSDAAELLRLA